MLRLLLLLLLIPFRSSLGQESMAPGIQATDPPRQFYIKKDVVDKDMERRQAFIVKDEDLRLWHCQAPKTNSDIRCSQTRYLMCTGSILTSRYILTSASCVHEALYIRHNIRAPLAAMVDTFSKEAQVLKVMDAIIHPWHEVDPRGDNYDLHNIAILKLACKITNKNVKAIELPDQPMGDLCGDESCTTFTIRQPSLRIYKIKQIKAKDVPMMRKKRRQVKRENNNKGCTETGTPVILKKVQSCLVSMSCDVIQPTVTWHYTDLYNNLDFIRNVITNGSPGNLPGHGGGDGPGSACSMCIFNFFIGDINIGDKCLLEPERSSPSCTSIIAQKPMKSRNKPLEKNDPKQKYFDAITDMYKNKYYKTHRGGEDTTLFATKVSEDLSAMKSSVPTKQNDQNKYTDIDSSVEIPILPTQKDHNKYTETGSSLEISVLPKQKDQNKYTDIDSSLEIPVLSKQNDQNKYTDIDSSVEIPILPTQKDHNKYTDIDSSLEISVLPKQKDQNKYTDIDSSLEIPVLSKQNDQNKYTDIDSSVEIPILPTQKDQNKHIDINSSQKIPVLPKQKYQNKHINSSQKIPVLPKQKDQNKHTDIDTSDHESFEGDLTLDELHHSEDDSEKELDQESEEAEEVYESLYRRFLNDIIQ